MTNVEALKGLFIALGGEASVVEDMDSTVEVLNAIAAKYEGDGDALTNAAGIAAITAVAENISGGGASDWSIATVTVTCSGLSEASQHLLIPAVYEDDSVSAVQAAEMSVGVVELPVPLYKGLAVGRISNLLGASVSVSGEVTTENSGNGVMFFVRGNGTITVTGS